MDKQGLNMNAGRQKERMSAVLGNYKVCNTYLINMQSMQIGWLAFFLSWIRRRQKQRRLSTIILPMERRTQTRGGGVKGGRIEQSLPQRHTIGSKATASQIQSLNCSRLFYIPWATALHLCWKSRNTSQQSGVHLRS